MDLNSAHEESLVLDWLNYLLEFTKEEEDKVRDDNEFNMPFIGIAESTVKRIFQIIEYLNLGTDTKYLTIHLYDKFMCNYFWEVYKDIITNGPSEDWWSRICKKVSSQSKLHLMSCMQLASKMDSHSQSLSVSQLLCVLQRMDKNHIYTRSAVTTSEFKVFKTVGFKMPLHTPLHCIEVLLVITGLRETSQMYDTCITLLDLAYLQHRQLYSHLQYFAQGHAVKNKAEKRNLMALKTNILFLAASIVLCASFVLSIENTVTQEIIAKLSDLIDIKDTDIRDMASIIFVMSIQE